MTIRFLQFNLAFSSSLYLIPRSLVSDTSHASLWRLFNNWIEIASDVEIRSKVWMLVMLLRGKLWGDLA